MRAGCVPRVRFLIGGLALASVVALGILAFRGHQSVERFVDPARFAAEARGSFFREEIVGNEVVLDQIPIHPFSPKHQRLLLRKPRGTKRWIILGESSARYLGEALGRLVGPEIQVVNMATGASTLEDVALRLDEASQYSPDVLIVMFGHNLYYHRPKHPWTDRLWPWLWRSPTLTRLGQRLLPPREDRSFLRPSARMAAYDAFLRRVIVSCKRVGCRPVFCTVGGNLMVPPDDMSGAMDSRFLEARYLYLTGEREAAIRGCRALASRGRNAYAAFQLGIWSLRAGRFDEAREALSFARDLSPTNRASGPVNELIRRRAAAGHAVLVDLERWIERRSAHGIPGWREFFDNQHLIHFGPAARQVLRVTGSYPSMLAGRSMPRSMVSRGRLIHAARMCGFPENRFTRAGLSFLAEEGPDDYRKAVERFPGLHWQRGLLMTFLADGLWAQGRTDDAYEANLEAQRLAPKTVEPELQRAFFDLERGRRDDARRRLLECTRRDPTDFEAAFFLHRLEKAPALR